MNIFGPVKVNQNELQNAVAANLASSPALPKPGQFYFDTAQFTAMFHNGTSFVPADASKLVGTIPAAALIFPPVDLTNPQTIAGIKTFSSPPVFSGASITPATIPNAAMVVNPLARANHTGTQPAATIIDLAATVKAYTLDSFTAPVASVPFNSQAITGLLDPVNAQDASTKNYVDSNIQLATLGIASKPAVAVVATTNQAALAGLPTIDSVTLSAGQRVLLVAQTNPTQNGVYVVAAGAWTRASGDASGGDELSFAAFWFVENGASFAGSQWRLAAPTSGTITPDTTPITITQFGQVLVYTGTNGVAVSGLAFSGVVAPLGGLITGATGFALDTTIAARKYSATIGDGVSTTLTVTHGLGSMDVIVSVRDATTNEIVYPTCAPATPNTVTVTFSYTPAANAYRVTVLV